MSDNFKTRIRELAALHPPYTSEAFNFISQAVAYTVGKLDAPRHVSGPELIDGIREYAHQQYGALGELLLESWGLSSCQAVGKAVYLMIDAELLGASKDDDPADFDLASPLFPAVEPNHAPRPHLPMIDER